MKNLHDFKNGIGFNERKEWSEEDFDRVNQFIKKHYEITSLEEKLKNNLYGLKINIEHYLRAKNLTSTKELIAVVEENLKALKDFENKKITNSEST